MKNSLKAKLKGLDLKREISFIFKEHPLSWQRSDQIYCSAN